MQNIKLIKEKAKEELREKIFHSNRNQVISLEGEERRKIIMRFLDEILRDLLSKEKLELPRTDLENIKSEIISETMGYGGLEDLLNDPSITDILVNSPSQVFIEKKGELERVDISFNGPEEIRSVIERMMLGTSRRIDQFSPFVDFKLEGGLRVTALIPPISSYPSLCIRKFTAEVLQPQDLVNLGTLSKESLNFLELAVRARLNILITGSTGAGKTTLLNALLKLVPHNQRMVIIEDTEELSISDDYHFLKLLTRPPNIEGKGEINLYDLVRLSLHLRPDRIIIGEVRGEESFYFLQAINTGHEGSMCTLHANDATDALTRLETLALLAKPNLQAEAVRRLLGMGIDLIIHLKRVSEGRRLISQMSEVIYEKGDYNIKDIFVVKEKFEDGKEVLEGRFTGYIPSFREKIKVRTGEDFFA